MKRIRVELTIIVEDADTDEIVIDQSFRTSQAARVPVAQEDYLKRVIEATIKNVYRESAKELDRRIP